MKHTIDLEKINEGVTSDYDEWVRIISDIHIHDPKGASLMFFDFFKEANVFMCCPHALFNGDMISAYHRTTSVEEMKTLIRDKNFIPYMCYKYKDFLILRGDLEEDRGCLD